MAYTTINKSTAHFNTKLYTGNDSNGHAQTGVGFQPDWTWIKNRDDVNSHALFDAVRGATKYIESDTSDAEATNSGFLQSFDTDGFTVGDQGRVNTNGDDYASWNWKANGTGSSNTDGSINTTATSANTTAGFSIVKYTGTGANATVGHGLGVAPKMIIVKNLAGGSDNWAVYHEKLGANNWLKLNTADAKATDTTIWNNTAPTSAVFSVGTYTNNNSNGNDMIAYCFAEKTGYSKFGNYTGNGNSNGPFIYTGFRPTWVMIKETSGSGAWRIYDSKRGQGGDNIGGNYKNALMADVNSVEESSATDNIIDALSNGFKLRYSYNDTNGDGGSYIYMAIGQSLVGSNNVPCTAR